MTYNWFQVHYDIETRLDLGGGNVEILPGQRVGFTTDRRVACECERLGLKVYYFRKDSLWITREKRRLGKFDPTLAFVNTGRGVACGVDRKFFRSCMIHVQILNHYSAHEI